MQAISAYTQIYDDLNGQDILKKIERCGRVCYKSEGKITEGSNEKFVKNIIKRGHEAVLEHGSFIAKTDIGFYQGTKYVINMMEEIDEFNSFLRFTCDTAPIISGNVRAWRNFFKSVLKIHNQLPGIVENFIKNNPILFPEFQEVAFRECVGDEEFEIIKPSDLQTQNEKLTHWDVTVKFVTDRGISHEIVRHRPASYCQESTRYCNYAKDDFGKEITVIIPPFLKYKSEAWNVWVQAMRDAEDAYFKLLDIGLTSQEARGVLPHNLKTELIMTANLAEWKWFFELRTSSAAHPQIVEVAKPLLEEMNELIPGVLV